MKLEYMIRILKIKKIYYKGRSFIESIEVQWPIIK